MTIVHISTDYPDSHNLAKTHAIANLVRLTSDTHDHIVFSLNREAVGIAGAAINRLRGASVSRFLRDTPPVFEIGYAAPRAGIGLRHYFENMAQDMAAALAQHRIKPTVIHGHKLTMEGIAARHLARTLGVPYILSLQGNTDQKILAARPDLRPLFRKVFHDAKLVFPFAPWALAYAESVLGRRLGPSLSLPCAAGLGTALPPRENGPALISAFHLQHARLKNFDRTVRAAAQTGKHVDGFSFVIAGGGDADTTRALKADAEKMGGGYVRLHGPIDHADMQQWMNGAGGFAMLSNRETFGMVFIEALYAGVPILYPTGRSVEGYFDNMPFAICADPKNIDEISAGMVKLCRDEVIMKKALHKWQLSPASKQFTDAKIAQQYVRGLSLVAAGA